MSKILQNNRPVSVVKLTPDDFPLENPENLTGNVDGSYCSAVQHYVDGQNDWTDSCIMLFDLPDSLSGAIIDGFRYRIKGCKIEGGGSRRGQFECSVMFGAFQRAGCAEIHQPSAADWPDTTVLYDIQSHLDFDTHKGPDGVTLFSGGGAGSFSGYNASYTGDFNDFYYSTNPPGFGAGNDAHMGNFALTFDDFAGITFRFRAEPSLTSDYTIYTDAFELDIYYTPAAQGAQNAALTASSVTTATASSISVPIPGGVECGWASASNALTVNTTIATSGVGDCSSMLTPPPGTTASDKLGYTQFLKYSFAANQLSGLSTQANKELRIVYRGRAQCRDYVDDGGGNLLGPDYVVVDDALLVNSAGQVVVQLSENRDVNDARGHKIGSYNWSPSISNATGFRRGERDRAICLDVSGLSPETIDDLNQNGFSVYIRWKLNNSNNLWDESTNTFAAIAVNGAVFSWSYDLNPSLALNPGNYLVCGARVYVRPSGEEGYICLGDAHNVQMPSQITTLDHYTSHSGSRKKDRIEVTEQSFDITFDLHEFTSDNLNLALNGDQVAEDTIDGGEFSESFSAVKGKAFRLERRNLIQSSVLVYVNSILKEEDSDYVVDYELGMITILNSGSIITGDEVEVEYEVPDGSESIQEASIRPGSLAGIREISGIIFALLDSQGRVFIWEHDSAIIQSNGAITLGYDDWSSMPMKVSILATTNSESPFGVFRLF